VPQSPDNRPLAIDAHSHVFNGTDLQVQQFIKLDSSLPYDEELKKIFGEIVEGLSWNLAPTGCQEYKVLGELASCGRTGARAALMSRHREQAYAHACREINSTPIFQQYKTGTAASRRLTGHMATDKRTQYLDSIGALLEAPTLADFRTKRALLAQNRALDVNLQDVHSVLRFLLQGFQYRYISVQDYLDDYNPAGFTGRSVDLMIANLVDFDWPLAGGAATRTPFRDQISVMERLSVFTRGRVHAFVPFDPMRQVAIAAGISPRNGKYSHLTFEDIQAAVMSHGFLGVKVYPVMGFQPTGNAALSPKTWAQPWLPEWMSKPIVIGGVARSFGEWLDAKLEALYSWAAQNGVPITSHVSLSNGPTLEFNAFALNNAWLQVLKQHPDLRLNLGHAGDPTGNLSSSSAAPSLPPAAKTVIYDYICAPGSAQRYTYGDVSYPAGALTNPAAYAPLLEALFLTRPQDGRAVPQDRLMYGTDWLMLLMEKNVDGCLSIAENALSAVDAALPPQTPSFSDRFFAFNAIRWLGLRPGESSWNRLETFYRTNGIDTNADPPAWMTKVRHLTQGITL